MTCNKYIRNLKTMKIIDEKREKTLLEILKSYKIGTVDIDEVADKFDLDLTNYEDTLNFIENTGSYKLGLYGERRKNIPFIKKR